MPSLARACSCYGPFQCLARERPLSVGPCSHHWAARIRELWVRICVVIVEPQLACHRLRVRRRCDFNCGFYPNRPGNGCPPLPGGRESRRSRHSRGFLKKPGHGAAAVCRTPARIAFLPAIPQFLLLDVEGRCILGPGRPRRIRLGNHATHLLGQQPAWTRRAGGAGTGDAHSPSRRPCSLLTLAILLPVRTREPRESGSRRDRSRGRQLGAWAGGGAQPARPTSSLRVPDPVGGHLGGGLCCLVRHPDALARLLDGG